MEFNTCVEKTQFFYLFCKKTPVVGGVWVFSLKWVCVGVQFKVHLLSIQLCLTHLKTMR